MFCDASFRYFRFLVQNSFRDDCGFDFDPTRRRGTIADVSHLHTSLRASSSVISPLTCEVALLGSLSIGWKQRSTRTPEEDTPSSSLTLGFCVRSHSANNIAALLLSFYYYFLKYI